MNDSSNQVPIVLGNQIGEYVYFEKKSRVENTPHQKHTYQNCINCDKKSESFSRNKFDS